MSEGEAPDFRRLARVCPHCGGREPTLGTVCPLCGEPYEPRPWTERGPIDVEDWMGGGSTGGWLVVGVLELVNLILAGIWALLTLPWRLLRRRGRAG